MKQPHFQGVNIILKVILLNLLPYLLTVEAKILCCSMFMWHLFLSMKEEKNFDIYGKVWGHHSSGTINILKK